MATEQRPKPRTRLDAWLSGSADVLASVAPNGQSVPIETGTEHWADCTICAAHPAVAAMSAMRAAGRQTGHVSDVGTETAEPDAG